MAAPGRSLTLALLLLLALGASEAHAQRKARAERPPAPPAEAAAPSGEPAAAEGPAQAAERAQPPEPARLAAVEPWRHGPERTVRVERAKPQPAARPAGAADAPAPKAPAPGPAAEPAAPVAAVEAIQPAGPSVAPEPAAPPAWPSRSEPLAGGATLLIGSLLLAAVLLVAARLVRRLPVGRFLPGGEGPIRITARTHLGAKEQLCLVEVGPTTLLLAIMPNGVRTLHVWPQGLPREARAAASPAGDGDTATQARGGVPGQLRTLHARLLQGR